MSMKKILCLCLALVLALAMTGCSNSKEIQAQLDAANSANADLQAQLDEANAANTELQALVDTYYPYYAAQIVATYGEDGVIWLQDVQEAYDSVCAQYASYGLDLAAYGMEDSVKMDLMASAVEDGVIKAKAAELGLDQFDEATMAGFQTSADEMMNDYVDYYVGYFYPDVTEVTDEMRTEAEAYWASTGFSREAYAEALRDDAINAAVYDYVTKDVAVSEEEVQSTYEALIANQQERYANDNSYYNDISSGATIAWNPEGYRTVKHVLIRFNDDQSARYSDLQSRLTSLNEEREAILAAEPADETAEAVAEPTESTEAATETAETVEASVSTETTETTEPTETTETTEPTESTEAATEPAETVEASESTETTETTEPTETTETTEPTETTETTEPAETVEATEAVEATESTETTEPTESTETTEPTEATAAPMRTLEEVDADIAACNAEMDALYAELMPTAEEVVAAFNEGTSFDELIEKYNEDPGMSTEPIASFGYPVSAASTIWDPAFTAGAMSISEIGQISEPVRGGYGIHIIYYLSDITPGEVALDEIHDQVQELALDDKIAATYNDQVAAWIEDANVEYFYANFGIAG